MRNACEVEIALSRDDRRIRWGQIINQTAQAYADVCNLPCLVAVTYDEVAKPNRELNAVAIEFKCDVANAVTKAIGNDLQLCKKWIALTEGNIPDSAVMAQLAVKLGPIFEKRELQPYRYFRTIKKGRPDRRPAVGIS